MRHRADAGRVLAAGACGALLLVLAGCASRAPQPPPSAPAPAAAEPAPAVEPPAPTLPEFETRQQRALEAAVQQGQWSQALWALDVLLALHPQDSELRRRRAQAQAAAQAAAAERLQRARQAQQRGDAEAASRLYLETLTLAPNQAEAAEGLRAIERERVRRLFIAQQSRAGRRVAPAPQATTAAPAGTPAAERNEVEHASMLAAQGELEGAIAVLKPIAANSRGDAAARSLLADLYFRQAEALAAADRAGAINALEQSLKADPGHPKAALRLKQLREAAKPGRPAGP